MRSFHDESLDPIIRELLPEVSPILFPDRGIPEKRYDG